MRVGLDLDGVLYNFGDSVRRYLETIGQEHLWKSGPTEKPYWDFYKDWGWTGEEFVQMCNDGVDAGVIFRGPAREHAVSTAWRLFNNGHDLVIITDRQFGSDPEKSHEATELWWNEHNFPPYHKLIFSSNKLEVYTDYFVEDKLENYDALTAGGVDTWLVNRPWNYVDGEDHDNRQRIDCVCFYSLKVTASIMERDLRAIHTL